MVEHRWRVPPGTEFRWRSWEDEFLVYHGESGDTHLLNPVAASALRFLEHTAATAEDLAAHVASELGLAPGEALAGEMKTLLETFDELGLVEPADEATRAERRRAG
jgi:PqqD family protein of HPr-rel-A system